jgi:hypothetical protein
MILDSEKITDLAYVADILTCKNSLPIMTIVAINVKIFHKHKGSLRLQEIWTIPVQGTCRLLSF